MELMLTQSLKPIQIMEMLQPLLLVHGLEILSLLPRLPSLLLPATPTLLAEVPSRYLDLVKLAILS